jgi:hypothetical protein
VSHYWIDPIIDSRWAAFVDHHASSSVFHTPAWLRALHRTYGFVPLILTTCPPGQKLINGISFCRINSVLTGRRLVSLPFSDHCQPLACPEDMEILLPILMDTLDRDRLKYVELRPFAALMPTEFARSQHYYFHLLDLRPPLDAIFRKLHNDCIRRKIRRAEREGLTSDAGRSYKLIEEFFNLQVATRRRFGLPPQPRKWFMNLVDAMGENVTIRVARFQGRPVASILMLRHKQTAIYKYGCSDANDSNRGGTQLLLWQAIEDAKSEGMEAMDLGRSDIDDVGLITFKERWGAERRDLEYLRYPAHHYQTVRKSSVSGRIMARLPNHALIAIGRLFYRHMA